ncbi:MAG: thioredoxin domain-containing protein [Chloroflexi bacterium]|nr:thioredoxin domain-containing protein [Chloroflexota bacterium]
MSDTQFTNRLAHETSPYLRQHAHNPVDWYPWGPEALERARRADKPILLSIGYAACHWCHVMAHESFEDEATARYMNEHFVNIKVDREERPDIDAIYMQAVQTISGHGGWPMTMFLQPDGKPFYGGTYYPPAPRHGLPSFRQVLESIASAYEKRKETVAQTAAELMQRLQSQAQVQMKREDLNRLILDDAVVSFEQSFDRVHGGFGGAPKFPQPMNLEFILRAHHRTRYPGALAIVEQTLQGMARGGMYDQIGGGFHRYSVDAQWLVPHFEKMLYDNAQLARVYLHAFQATGNPFYAQIVAETLDYVAREMTHPDGGFYATQDADSEGVEGKFYVWTPDEIAAVLGRDDARIVCAYYDVTEAGNFEEHNILNVPQDAEAVARELKLPVERLRAVVAAAKPKLYAARAQRIWPGRDEKVLTAWNGMMLCAFAEASRVLDRADYRQIAERNAEFVLRTLSAPGDGPRRLLRTWKDGQAKLNAYLEDYANLADGFITLYEATFDARWLADARSLAAAMIARFWSDATGGFYDTSDDHETLITRPRDLFDNATPSGGSVAAGVLLKLAAIDGDEDASRRVVESLKGVSMLMRRYPSGFGQWLGVLDFYLAQPREIALLGDAGSAALQSLAAAVFRPYLPNRIILHAPDEQGATAYPLLEGKTLFGGRATAYVCEHYVCQAPVTDPRELEEQLRA